MRLPTIYLRIASLVLLLAMPALADQPPAAPVVIRQVQGTIHGFLALRTTDGEPVADGDLTQTVRGDRVTTHLVFHFKDDSVNDETVVYSQRRAFRLLSYHLVQKGPAFKRPTDMTIDGTSGRVTVHYTEEDGKEKETTERLTLPANLANGMVPILLANLQPKGTPVQLSMVAATPKPRLVKLNITAVGQDSFAVGNSSRKATHYTIKIEVGGVAGVVAPLVGKQPPDVQIWIMQSDVPVFVKSEGTLFEGGPIWRTELASPVWH